jgi:hypothetical protein
MILRELCRAFPEHAGWIIAVVCILGILGFIIEQACKPEEVDLTKKPVDKPGFRSSESLFTPDGSLVTPDVGQHSRYTEDKKLPNTGIIPSKKTSFTK